MFQKSLIVYGTFIAFQILPTCGFNDTRLAGDVIDVNAPKRARGKGRNTGVSWPDSIPKGRALWQAWRQKSGSDTPPPPALNRTFDFEIRHSPYANLRNLLRYLAMYEHATDVFTVECRWPAIPECASEWTDHTPDPSEDYKAEFEAAVIPSQGLFISEANAGSSELPSQWKYSYLAWYMWTLAVRKQYPNINPPRYSGLAVFMQRDIRDPTVRSLIKTIVKIEGIHEGTEMKLDHRYNGYWSLLGSPFGEQLIEMLTENKAALKPKGVKYFVIRHLPRLSSSKRPIYDVWAELR